MICDEERLLAFLSDDVDETRRNEFDAHLLGCERCWTAVREDRRGRALAELLREPAPAGLADRIRLAAATVRPVPAPAHRRRSQLVVGSVAASLVVVVALLLAAAPWRSAPAARSAAPSMTATAALVGLGQALPTHVVGPRATTPRMLGRPMTMSIGSVSLQVTYYRVDDGEAVVAHSMQAFAMPSGGTAAAGGRAWTAQVGGMSIYCLCGAGLPDAAIVAPMRPGAVTELAAFLGMPT
jgi:hypothetical protein